MSEPGSGGSRAVLPLAAVLVVAGLGAIGFLFLRPSGPQLLRVEPLRARAGDNVILHGQGFDPTPQGNTALFGDRTGRVVGASPTQLTVEVPAFELADDQTSNIAVRVIVGQRATQAAELQLYQETALPAEVTTEAGPPPVETAETAATVPAETIPGTAVSPAAARPATPRPRAPKPTPAPAVPGPSMAPAPPGPLPVPPAQRRFVLERTAVESNKRVSADLEGFETDGVAVKRAPDVLGRVDFEVQPPQVKPGDRFSVSVYMNNDGKKDIKLSSMFVATSINGRLVSGPASLRARDVGPKGKKVIATFNDTWRDTIATWAMDVTVTSDRGDVYKNQVVWK